MSTYPVVDGPMMALFPRTRRAVLGLLYSHPDEAFYLRQIIEITGLAVGQVQREAGGRRPGRHDRTTEPSNFDHDLTGNSSGGV